MYLQKNKLFVKKLDVLRKSSDTFHQSFDAEGIVHLGSSERRSAFFSASLLGIFFTLKTLKYHKLDKGAKARTFIIIIYNLNEKVEKEYKLKITCTHFVPQLFLSSTLLQLFQWGKEKSRKNLGKEMYKLVLNYTMTTIVLQLFEIKIDLLNLSIDLSRLPTLYFTERNSFEYLY
ncbi:hypothetical protein BpHYR1_053905 [Brachionus plicatilis]|uniref:Uncharacterized protein n=1 Tax=Brachionus plicatilis TaxID=10195 RepID=A0A3M7T6K6_BRAPC|nr:hypothetical protein BpHYR1_053905 [Brachionus plicatilis]